MNDPTNLYEALQLLKMYNILRNDFLLRNVVLERVIQKQFNQRNVSTRNNSQIVYYNYGLFFLRVHYPCRISAIS